MTESTPRRYTDPVHAAVEVMAQDLLDNPDQPMQVTGYLVVAEIALLDGSTDMIVTEQLGQASSHSIGMARIAENYYTRIALGVLADD